MADKETDHSNSSTASSPVQQNEDVGGQQFPAYQNLPVQTAPVPPQAQTAASLPSSPQTFDIFKNLSPTPAPFQSPVQTAGRVSLSHLAKETPSSSESALTVLSLGPMPPHSHVPPLAQNASSLSHFPLNVTVSQPLSSDQLISSSRGSELAQASNASTFRPFQKRQATQLPPTCGRAVRGRIDPSVQASSQAAPPPLAHPNQNVLLPPRAQIAPASFLTGTVCFPPTFPPTYAPPAQIASPGSRFATGTPPLRMSQDLVRTDPPTVPACFFCTMSLELGALTEYPCGHRYHTECVQRFASTVQIRNLPCVLCNIS